MIPERPDADQRPAAGKAADPWRFAVPVLAAVAVLLGGYIWLDARSRPAPARPAAVAPQPAPAASVVPPPMPGSSAEALPEPPPQPGPVAVVPEPRPAPTPVAPRPPRPSPFRDVEPPRVSGLQTSGELAAQARLLDTAISSGRWPEYRALLERALADALGPNDGPAVVDSFGPLFDDPLFRQAVLRRETIVRLPADDLARIAGQPEGPECLRWLLTSDPVMEELLLTMRPDDDPGKVLAMVHAAWSDDPALAGKYHALAIACGVVFDRPVTIQHGDDYSQGQEISGIERYRWYVDQNERGKLVVSIDRSPAEDLAWVVCAPVTTSELEWAVKHMSLSRRGWGEAYAMVEYLMERAVEGLDPYEEYTFAEILDKGGVCGDQAYFCANTARANGIPAAIRSGETNAGAHAWVALKSQPDEWDTGVGRIGGVSIGRTTDPRNGSPVSEQEFWLWNEDDLQRRSTVLAVHSRLWLAGLLETLGRNAGRAAAIRQANRVGHKFPLTWAALFDLMAAEAAGSGDRSADAVVDSWKRFVADLRREFRDNPRMASLADRAENEHVFPFAELDYARAELRRQRRRIEREAEEQSDLLAASLKREAMLVLQRDPGHAMLEISRLYDSALREHGAGVTGFKQMAEDYFSFTQHDPEYGPKAVRDIELAFKRVIETGTKEWFRANTEAGIYRMICGFYRAVGDDKRAALLEARFERLVERAKRGAL